MAFSYSPKIVTDNLVFCYDAANTRSYISGSTTWNDLSKSNLNGTLVASPAFTSSFGGGISFISSSKQYVTSSNIFITGSQTFSVWAMLENPSVNLFVSGPIGLLTHHAFNYPDQQYGITGSNFGICVGQKLPEETFDTKLKPSIGYQNAERTFYLYESTVSVTGSVPFNAVLVYNAPENKIYWYFNGKLDSSWSLGSKIPNASSWPIQIGIWSKDYSYNHFNGNVYHATVYSKALSANEALQNYNALKSRFQLT